MFLLILAILAVLTVLILAGPVLEDLFDRFWPPDRTQGRAKPGAHR